MEPEICLPAEWPEWKITELIGTGSYGSVYRAERRLDDETLVSAVKVIPIPPDSENENSILRQTDGDRERAYEYCRGMVREYEREIRAMNSLKGITNIVSIEDYAVVKRTDRIGWLLYLRMEFLECFTEWIAEHQMGEEDVIRMGIDLCSALSYCEKAQIIHRDIKPENIFVTKYGNFKLGDFGIARQMDLSAGTYTQRGTYAYMAPEVFHGSRYDSSVDLYSLGLVLYVIVNGGRGPFLDPQKQILSYQDRQKAIQKRMDGEQLPPPRFSSDRLSKIILRACAYRPQDRYSSADQMKRALETLLFSADSGYGADFLKDGQATASDIPEASSRLDSPQREPFPQEPTISSQDSLQQHSTSQETALQKPASQLSALQENSPEAGIPKKRKKRSRLAIILIMSVVIVFVCDFLFGTSSGQEMVSKIFGHKPTPPQTETAQNETEQSRGNRAISSDETSSGNPEPDTSQDQSKLSGPIISAVSAYEGDSELYFRSSLFGIVLSDQKIIVEYLDYGVVKDSRKGSVGESYKDDGSEITFSGKDAELTEDGWTYSGSSGIVHITYTIEKTDDRFILTASVGDHRKTEFEQVSGENYLNGTSQDEETATETGVTETAEAFANVDGAEQQTADMQSCADQTANQTAPAVYDTIKNVNLRDGPSTDGTNILTTIGKGNRVTGTGNVSEDGQWLEVIYGDLTGWVSSSLLQQVSS